MPVNIKRQRHAFLNPLVLRVISIGGLVACLSLTFHLHGSLDVDSPSHPPPLRRSPQHSAAAVVNNHAAVAATDTDGIPPRHAVNVTSAHNRAAAAAAKAAATASEEGIAACLLVNDENPRLPEWIAYHYQTLPLRSLIVAVDPASRSSPHEILLRWYEEMGLDVKPWSEHKYLPPDMRGPCKSDDPEKCLWHHRDRQQCFIMKCMSEFKKMNKKWVLLVDVDEYVVFNQIREDDPVVPLDAEDAPEGIPVMDDWRFHDSKISSKIKTGAVDGYVDGVYTRSELIFVNNPNDTTTSYGSVVEDIGQKKYFLRDDIAFHEATAFHAAPPGIPTLKEPFFAGTALYARIHNDTYDNNEDNSFVPIPMEWKIGDEKMRKFYGGHLTKDANGREYYLENEAELWPPHYKAKDAIGARRRLPSVGEGVTVLDVLKRESEESYAEGVLGPCLSMPRLLYGSREDGIDNGHEKMAPGGFDDQDFVTLRYRWHASKGEFDASRYGKTIIDVSRIPYEALRGKALNIHRPLTYYCRKDPARYVMAFLRVNHYLDSFEAYSYRNDARSSKRQCRECYDEKGKGAAAAMDNDIRPWLRSFVETVGPDKAKKLLAGAGDFVQLS